MVATINTGFCRPLQQIQTTIRTIKNKLLPVAIFIAALACCFLFIRKPVYNVPFVTPAQQAANRHISAAAQQLKDGDIVLRTGRDATSSMFCALNQQNPTYSHCGIFFREGGRGYVFHCVGGEDNPNALLRKDPFEFFVKDNTNAGFGICRYALTEAEKSRLQATVYRYYKEKLHFDMQFSLATDTAMYCAEFVYKSFSIAKNTDSFMHTSVIKSFRYEAIDNLFLNVGAQMVCEVKY